MFPAGIPLHGNGGPLVIVKSNRVAWRKSSVSGSENCVEVAAAEGSVLIRNSKDPHGPMLTFSGPEWAWFLARMHKGEFDSG